VETEKTEIPGFPPIYWLTLPLTDTNPSITVRISTSQLAETIGPNVSQETLTVLIEELRSFQD